MINDRQLLSMYLRGLTKAVEFSYRPANMLFYKVSKQCIIELEEYRDFDICVAKILYTLEYAISHRPTKEDLICINSIIIDIRGSFSLSESDAVKLAELQKFNYELLE